MLSPTRARATLARSRRRRRRAAAAARSPPPRRPPAAAEELPAGRAVQRRRASTCPYCTVYDTSGREKMGADNRAASSGTSPAGGPARRPAGVPGQDIPWNKVTHLNYAFAHVDGANKISVGATRPNNSSTGMAWPGVAGAEMDPSLPYKGHFNLLTSSRSSTRTSRR